MTRYARSGGTQRHSRQPADPTPWEEYAQGKETSNPQRNNEEKLNDNEIGNSETEMKTEGQEVDAVAKPSMQQKKFTNEMTDTNKRSFQNSSQSKFKGANMRQRNQRFNNSYTQQTNKHNNSYGQQQSWKTFRENARESRRKMGISLLSEKAERKIYLLKRKLRKQGMPEQMIKDATRQLRRREEMLFKRTLKTCYKCRKVGHVLSDCPLIAEDNEQSAGICFKCGSAEHSSHQCSSKTNDYPFAKCFICHEVGHLSRTCPKNDHGVYPNGGKCNFCGKVDHMKQDCPELKKKVMEEEEEIMGDVIANATSIDEEFVETEVPKPLPTVKKAKIIKF